MIDSNTLRETGLPRYRGLAAFLMLCFGLTAASAGSNRIEFPQFIQESWDASRGYPGGRVYGITQTTDGYLWIGTDRGLIRFDGSVFRVFRETQPNHAPISLVFSLAGDLQGNLLISTKGLQRIRLRNEELEELPRLPRQPTDILSAIYPGPNGAMLSRVRAGMVAYDGKGFTTLSGSFPQITAAVQARDGIIWMGTAKHGLFTFPDRLIEGQPAILRQLRINALVPFGEHGLTVGADEGLMRWEGAKGAALTGPRHIQVMLEDRQKNLWLGSTEGLYRLASDDAAQATVPYLHESVTCLFEDREGDIWVGVATGIVRFRQRILTTHVFEPDAGQSGGLFVDGQGAVWYTRSNLGLIRVADGRIERTLATGDYSSIAGSARGVWVGQKDGALLRVDLPSQARASVRKEAQVGRPVIAMFENHEGTLWVGTQNGGVAEVANGQITFHSKADNPILDTVADIEQSRDGVMWFATNSGVASLSRGRWQIYAARDGLPPGRINCLLADESGVIWVGADQGLAYIENGRARTLASSLPLLQEPIFGIAQDRYDSLWVLTSSHVFRVKRAELLHSGSASIFLRQFGIHDGLPAVAPSRGRRSVVTDGAGRIWMSMGNALVMADPTQLRQPSPPTLIQFQRVSADEIPLPLAEAISVPAGQVRTVIRFAGLNLAAPDRVRFRYRLTALEDHWSEPTSVNEASYTNLTPGAYRFEVQASNIDGLWNGPTAKIGLYVEPALWQALWFRGLVALVISAMGFAAYQFRLSAVKRQWDLRFQERLDERTRIARDLHDTLLQSFHGLILRFQAVRDLLPEQPEIACEELGSAIDRAAEAITEGRDAVQALRGEEEYDNLADALAAIDREFRTEFPSRREPGVETRYRVLMEGTPRRLHPVVRDDLYRIAREAVRNSFRHAHASQIELDIRYDESALRLRVRDDGSGIDPHVLNSGRRQGHYGLPGMRERATSIGGQFEIWSELRRGTEIEITIPGMIAYVRFGNTENADLY